MARVSEVPRDLESSALTIGQLFGILRRGWWLVAATAILGTGLGYWHTKRRGSVWRASSLVYVERDRPSLVGDPSVSFASGARNYADTQQLLMISAPQLAASLALARQDAAWSEDVFQGSMNAIAWLKKNLLANAGQDDGTIQLRLDSPHRDAACVMLNAVVDSFVRFHEEQAQTSTGATYRQLTREKDRLDGEYAAKLQAIRELAAPQGQAGGRTPQEVAWDAWQRLGNELSLAEAEARTAAQLWQSAKDFGDDPEALRQLLPVFGGGTTLPAPTASRRELEAQHAAAVAEFSAEHPTVLALERAIAELDAQEQRLATQYVAALARRATMLEQRHASLSSRSEQLEAEIARLVDTDAQRDLLTAEAEQIREALQTVGSLMQNVNLGDVSGAATVHVLERASPDNSLDVSNSLLRIAALGLVGLIAGLGLAWVRGLMDQRIRDESSALALGLPLLGVLPRQSRRHSVSAAARLSEEPADREAFRRLSAAVEQHLPTTSPRTLLVAAVDDPASAHLAAAALGVTFARQRRSTLVIDTDLDNPQQHRLLEAAQSHGLAALIDGNPTAGQVSETAIHGLHLLGESQPLAHTTTLHAGDLQRVRQELSQEYDMIIVVTAPTASSATAAVLAPATDAIVLCVHAQKTPTPAARRGVEDLRRAGATRLGTVLDGVPRPRSASSSRRHPKPTQHVTGGVPAKGRA